MDIICLINLLKEKEYITVEEIQGNYSKELVGYYIESKYPEIIDKIQHTRYQTNIKDDIVAHRNDYAWQSTYRIVYVSKVKNDIEKFFQCLDKETGRYCCEGVTTYPSIREQIEKKTAQYYDWGSNHYGGSYITDLNRRQQRITKENNDRNEMLNFLKSLP